VILVDTSVWIELLNGRLTPNLSSDELLLFVTCGPVVQEVLQGLRDVPASEAFSRRAFGRSLPERSASACLFS